MARLQILELPKGDGDERPPFILVVDEYEPTRYVLGIGEDESIPVNPFEGVAERIGARQVLVFEETVDIPANDVPVDPDGYPLKIRIEPDFEQFHEQVQGEVYAAQEAIRSGIRYVKDHYGSLSTGRPTHPDGTPYTYNEIVTGGWSHCDDCHTWGQWTAEQPHNCPGTYISGPVANPAADA